MKNRYLNISNLFKSKPFTSITTLIILIILSNLSAEFATTMTSNTQEIHDFLIAGSGSASSKMVYINLDNSDNTKELCYIDFSEEIVTPVVHIIKDAKDARLPVISPDGNWVVYATGQGAEAGSPVGMRSSVYICKIATNATPVQIKADSACEPRFMQSDNELVVIYTTLAPNFAWESVGQTMKVEIDVSSGIPVPGTPTPLFSKGSYTGGLSRDSTFLCGGGGEIVMLDISSGKDRPDTISTFSQSCNASISSSNIFTNTMMYLTMSGSDPLVNNNTKWETWQVILINSNKIEDGKGTVLKGFWYPTTYKYPLETTPDSSLSKTRWHHCEWSNHPYFAVATLNADRYFKNGDEWVNTKYQERLYLINLKDSAYIEILRPNVIKYNNIPDDNSGLHWPWLWVGIPENFIEDDKWLSVITDIEDINTLGMYKNMRLSFSDYTITSSTPIQSLAIYKVNGRCIKTIAGNNRKTIRIEETIRESSTGIYLLSIKTINNITRTIQIVISK